LLRPLDLFQRAECCEGRDAGLGEWSAGELGVDAGEVDGGRVLVRAVERKGAMTARTVRTHREGTLISGSEKTPKRDPTGQPREGVQPYPAALLRRTGRGPVRHRLAAEGAPPPKTGEREAPPQPRFGRRDGRPGLARRTTCPGTTCRRCQVRSRSPSPLLPRAARRPPHVLHRPASRDR